MDGREGRVEEGDDEFKALIPRVGLLFLFEASAGVLAASCTHCSHFREDMLAVSSASLSTDEVLESLSE